MITRATKGTPTRPAIRFIRSSLVCKRASAGGAPAPRRPAARTSSSFGKNGWTAHRGVDLARERLHELDQIGLLLCAERERPHVGREPPVLHAAPVVVGDDVGKRPLAAVVHVR